MEQGRTKERARGMHTAEYAVCFGLVVAAIVGMQTFVKRAIQARIKAGTDIVAQVTGSPVTFNVTDTETTTLPMGSLPQYEPYYGDSDQTSDRQGRTVETHVKDPDTGKANLVARDEANRQTRQRDISSQGEAGASGVAGDDDWK